MPNLDAVRRLVETGALHTAACAVHLQAPLKGPCHCESDVESILRTLVEAARLDERAKLDTALRLAMNAEGPWCFGCRVRLNRTVKTLRALSSSPVDEGKEKA